MLKYPSDRNKTFIIIYYVNFDFCISDVLSLPDKDCKIKFMLKSRTIKITLKINFYYN